MKLIITFIIIILLIVLIFNKKNELFIDEKLKATILRGISLNMGEIENLNSLTILSIPDSEKLLIENIVKNYTVKNLIFEKNLELKNYTYILDGELQNMNPNKLELVYDKQPMENIHSLPISFAVGPNFKTNENNPYYGVQMRYRINDNSFANRAEIGIEYKSYMDIPIGKLLDMSNKFQDEDYKKMRRKRVEVIGPETKKFEFLPYFRDGNIKSLILFKDSKNKEFLEETEGYFNLNDEKGNRIFTKCKIDTPYCNTHLPQKGKIYGRDNYIATKFYPFDNKFRVIADDDVNVEELRKQSNVLEENSNPVESFVGNFTDTSNLPNEIKLPPHHESYKKYLTKKDCINEKTELNRQIKDDHYLEENDINMIASKKDLEPLQRLKGINCIKHFDKYRDDYFFGGFDRDNNMVCYGKNQDCIMFPSKEECEKMDLNTLLSIPEGELVKGLKNDTSRTLYNEESLDMLSQNLKGEKEEKEEGYEVKCGTGKYLKGTFNPEDDIQIVGGYFKNCKDPQHPEHEDCSETPGESQTYHLSELITTKGRKKYDKTKEDKYSKFGDLDGECIDNNVPEGRLGECDAMDDYQPCYIGERPGLVPGESISNSDIYNKFLGYNCHTYTLDTNTCKHNNQGVLSDVISFSEAKEKDYLNLVNNQDVLEMSIDYDFDMLSDEEKYRAKYLFLFMEKYFEKYEDMNPRTHINLRYNIKFEPYYDLITKKTEIIINVYHRGKKEATLNNNQGDIHFLQDGDIIEILLQKDNHIIFKIINPATKLVTSQHISNEKIEGEYGSNINFYISQNNNTFLRDIKYKELIPKTVLPYNPFINITQL